MYDVLNEAVVSRGALARPVRLRTYLDGDELTTYVADGLFDLGITGQDWIAETGSDVEVLTSISYAKTGTGHGTTIVLAVPNEHPANSAKEMPAGSRISTEFVQITERPLLE